MLALACPSCGVRLKPGPAMVGKKAKCPRCGHLIDVPASTEPAPPSAPPSPLSAALTDTSPPPAAPALATHPGGTAARPTPSSPFGFLAPPQTPDELGRLGGFRVLGVLGEGGMGVVFRAEDAALRRPVALKVMKPGMTSAVERDRFLREARTVASVEHENVIAVHQVGEDRGVPYLAMPLLAGESLEERLRRDGRLPTAEVLRIGRAMAEGLAAAHDAGLVHRDIKPANVFLTAPRRNVSSADESVPTARPSSPGAKPGVKLLDFGLAREVKADDGLTREGAILGTPAYMAPEQTRGEPTDARSDLFSLGCVLYRLCTGEPAFRGKDVVSTLVAVAVGRPPSPRELCPDVPPELSALVMRLLTKEPAGRPASAHQVADELAAPAEPGDTPTTTQPLVRPVASPTPPRKGGRTLRWAVALLATAALSGWLATVVLRVETAEGTLVVEVNDPETEARIKGGKVVLTGPDGGVRYTLAAGERGRKIDAGPYQVRIEGADGLRPDTTGFTLTKGGTVTVRVTAEPEKVAAKPIDPDRKAAEHVLSVGGTVRVNGEERDIKALADLPREPFSLTSVVLFFNKQVSDAGLAPFKDCKNLKILNLYGSPVSDAGLAHFKGCKNLTVLELGDTKLSDAGLAFFKDCKNLTVLELYNTRVSDAGLASFNDCKSLTHLHLGGTRVSDAGLAPFKDCKNLKVLILRQTKITAAKIEELKKAFPACKIEWSEK